MGSIDHVTYDSPQFIALLIIGTYLYVGFSYGKFMVLGIDCLTVQARDRTIIGVLMFNFIQHFCFHLYWLLIQMFGIVVKDLTISNARDVADVAPAVAILSKAALCCRILHSAV